MNRLQAFMGGMCMLALALGPAVAEAQPMPENNPQACHDGIDNDGNGYVDCYDQQCAPFCQPPQQGGYGQPYGQPPPAYGQPPPAYGQPPPPNYYQQPPPPNYYQQQPPPRPVYVMAPPPPRNGIAQIVTGFILLPLGIIFVGASAVLWNDGCANGRPCFDVPGTQFYSDAVGALVLDMFGIAFIIAGLVLIPVGFAHYARWRRWRDRQQGIALYDTHGLTLEPVFGGVTSSPAAGAAPSLASGSFGLKLSF